VAVDTDLAHTFLSHGFQAHPGLFEAASCRGLLAQALATRDLADLFLSEAEFRSAPVLKGTNPRPGRNLLARLDCDFIFSDPRFVEMMAAVCGPHWRVLDHKFVMGVPHRLIPAWLQAELGDRLVANLGAYVKPQYRDITYFRGIDFHQDIIDFPDRESDFITAYVYLDDVGEDASPLHVLPGSQALGATLFPHDLTRLGEGGYRYRNGYGDEMEAPLHRLTGTAGTLYYWHCNTLHGTRPHGDEEARLSVRILVERNARSPTGGLLDQVNAQTRGALSLAQTRRDLDSTGQAVLSGNTINRN
jgi:Protein involved in biosynthesis of mitomycin antibiotics/polyketide fumonisin